MKLTDELFKLEDKEYAEFSHKITPNIDGDCFIGVRLPQIRKIAKEYSGTKESREFLDYLPHKYLEENMLHGMLISNIKDLDLCINELDKFLPYVDNWAVCDTMSPVIFKKYKQELLIKIKEWTKSKHLYTARFGIGMLMKHFLDEDFKKDYLKIPLIKTKEYYLQMMIAWFYATALAKQWDSSIPYIENNKLDTWIHNKTIQKSIESYRITDEQKDYLRTLRRS